MQIGVQAMSDDSYRTAAEAIRAGKLGQVVQAQIEYVRRYDDARARGAEPSINDDTPKPADLDWDTWLGDAPKIAWNPHHYYEWRNYAAYSGGISTDLFIHRITRIMKACDLLYPRRVVGMGGIWQWPDGRDLPDNFEMICEYPRGMTVYVLGTMSNRVGIDHLIRGYVPRSTSRRPAGRSRTRTARCWKRTRRPAARISSRTTRTCTTTCGTASR